MDAGIGGAILAVTLVWKFYYVTFTADSGMINDSFCSVTGSVLGSRWHPHSMQNLSNESVRMVGNNQYSLQAFLHHPNPISDSISLFSCFS